MASAPRIIIPAALGRSYTLAEIPLSSEWTEMVLAEDMSAYKKEETESAKLWVFPTPEAAAAWAALRTKELSFEGANISSYSMEDINRAVTDERVRVPLEKDRDNALKQMLKW